MIHKWNYDQKLDLDPKLEFGLIEKWDFDPAKVQTWIFDPILQFGSNTGVWIQYWSLDPILEFGSKNQL